MSRRAPRGRRPTLSAGVSARRYVEGGEVRVVLERRRDGRAVVIGEREWTILSAGDGSRDLAGIRLAAAWRGREAGADDVESFFDELERAGFLAGDEEATAEAGPALTREAHHVTRAAIAGRPLDPLPGYRFRCDGRGTCCRFFRTVLFSPQEATLARALCPEVLDGGDDEDQLFTAERGSRLDPAGAAHGVRAVTLVDGRCAFLAGDGRCRLHQLGGARAKPAGCRLFPAVFVDDGERLRVSVAPECACVFRAIEGPQRGGVPLVPEGTRSGADLPASAQVRQLPQAIPMTPATVLARADYVAWADDALANLERGESGDDVARWLWSLADALAAEGRGASVGRCGSTVEGRLMAIRSRARWRLDRARAWVASPRASTSALEAIVKGCDALLDDVSRLPEPCDRDRADERLYARTSIFGHLIVEEGRVVVDSLRSRAARLWLARTMTDEEHPLALVESAFRADGLDGGD